MVADNINHTGAALQMNTGEERFPRPSMGAWINYGLGTENQYLPGFVVISPQSVFQGSPLWGSSFLPGTYQATWVRDLEHPISCLKDSGGDLGVQRAQLDTLNRLNDLHKRERASDNQLEARIASFELAFRMQMAAPEAFDLTRESGLSIDGRVRERSARDPGVARVGWVKLAQVHGVSSQAAFGDVTRRRGAIRAAASDDPPTLGLAQHTLRRHG